MAVIDWILQYKWIILFYLAIGLIIYFNRKKWQVENKFILIYRTKWGIKLIDKFADKNKEFVKVLGYSAIGVGFVGMITIIGFFVKGLYDIIFVPGAPPTMSLVIPGVQIPGSPVFVPFWYGIIALFIVIVFHEFGHGIVARAHGIPVKNTGLVFFGPLPGAFVEPDEKKITKSPSPVQISMFASGPFFNAILAAIVALVLFGILNPLTSSMVNSAGVQLTNLQEGQPAYAAGLQTNVTYTLLNDQPMQDTNILTTALSCSKPGDNITFRSTDSSVMVTLGENPNGGTNGYLGVTGIKTDYKLKNDSLKIPYGALFILSNLLEWIFLLSLGIGLANLLPLGPVDGGRMLQTTLVDMKGKEKGTKLWMRISLITFIVLIILVLVPIIKSVLFKI
jgi:membrane-associated protease RseP (regulator of RpoE activity)